MKKNLTMNHFYFTHPLKLYHEDKEILINQPLISFKYAHFTWKTLKSMLNAFVINIFI